MEMQENGVMESSAAVQKNLESQSSSQEYLLESDPQNPIINPPEPKKDCNCKEIESLVQLIDSLRTRIEELEIDSIIKDQEIKKLQQEFSDFQKEGSLNNDKVPLNVVNQQIFKSKTLTSHVSLNHSNKASSSPSATGVSIYSQQTQQKQEKATPLTSNSSINGLHRHKTVGFPSNPSNIPSMQTKVPFNLVEPSLIPQRKSSFTFPKQSKPSSIPRKKVTFDVPNSH